MIGWLLSTLTASTLTMLAVLALRRPVRRLAGAQIAYALWAMPVLRLLLPPFPATWLGRWPAWPMPAVPAGLTRQGSGIGAAEAGWQADLCFVAIAVWMTGALLVIAVEAIRYRRFAGTLRRGIMLPMSDSGVTVFRTPAVSSPVAFGILRPAIAIPIDFRDRFDAAQREMILAHERAHHARGDLRANGVALVV